MILEYILPDRVERRGRNLSRIKELEEGGLVDRGDKVEDEDR
jgi:hypothetical protein